MRAVMVRKIAVSHYLAYLVSHELICKCSIPWRCSLTHAWRLQSGLRLIARDSRLNSIHRSKLNLSFAGARGGGGSRYDTISISGLLAVWLATMATAIQFI